ncbi:MAG: sulfatase-like hydrolase/transferase [Planctomycetota bacterium]
MRRAAATLLLAVAAQAPAAGQNVLVILADDLGVDWLGAYGLAADPPSTPHIDALAADGVTFVNAWGYPMCSPARAAVQTGRYGFRTGMGHIVDESYGLPLAEVTLPEMLDLGTGGAYAHAFFGKWHLASQGVGGLLAPNLAGWGHFAGTSPAAGAVLEGEDYFHWTKVTDGVAEVVDAYATTDTVDDALAWISARTAPWLCFVSPLAVHTPHHAPPAALHSVDLSGAGAPAQDPEPYFRAMVEALDAELGRLLGGVDPATTTVVLAADNGTSGEVLSAPFPPGHGKATLFEGGLRVPLIVRGPSVAQPGATCEALVAALDVFATVAELAQVDLAAALPGVVLDSISLLPYLADPSLPSLRPWVFAEHFVPNGPTSGPIAPALLAPVCQPDLGFGGPGDAALSLCGPPLVEFSVPELAVVGVPPFAPVFTVFSTVATPVPSFGGTLVPNPIIWVVPAVADSAGEARYDLPVVGPGPVPYFVQAAALDAAQPLGVAITNALQANYQPWNTKAIRGPRWKLVAEALFGYHRLYDLEQDPLELIDLLADGVLEPTQQGEYDALLQALEALVAAP